VHTNEGRKIGHVAIPVIGAQKFDIARFVEIPFVLNLGGILDCREHKVSEKPCGATVPVREQMDSHGLGVNHDSQLSRCPVIGVVLAVGDGVERITQFNGNLLRCDADIDLCPPPPPSPAPHGTEQAHVEVKDEVVAKNLIERQ